MNINMKKGIAGLLAATMLLMPLAGCSDDKDKNQDKNNGGNNQSASSEFVYVPEYISLPSDVSSVDAVVYSNGYIYLGSYVEKPGEPYLIRMDDAPIARSAVVSSVAIVEGGGTVYYESTVGGDVVAGTATVAPPAEGDETAEGEAAEPQIGDYMLPMPEDGVIPDGYMAVDGTTNEYTLARLKVDGTGYEALPEYEPPVEVGMQTGYSVNRIISDVDGDLLVLENVYEYSKDDDYKDTYLLRKLDENGKEIMRLDLSSLRETGSEYFYVSAIATDSAGNVYVSAGENGLYVLDGEGNVLFNISTDYWIDSIVSLSNGTVAAMSYGDMGMELRAVDINSKGWGTKYPLKGYPNTIVAGSAEDEYDFYYSDGMYFYGYKIEESKEEQILNWINSNVNGDYMSGIIILDDGTILCISNDWGMDEKGDYYNSYEFVRLVKTPSSEVAQKTTLTLAVMWLPQELRRAVLEFNKKSATHRIEVKDYSQYNGNTEETWNAGLTTLNTEIISGDVPDIIVVQDLPMQQYIAKGLLEDLYPYIDNDPDYSRDTLVDIMFRALDNDGKMYQLSSSFSIQSVIGNKDVIGAEKSWTTGEALAILAKAPQGATIFDRYTTKESVLQQSIAFDYENYVDWNTGKCSFDSEEFIKLLEFANTFPETYDWTQDEPEMPELVQQGLQLATTFYLSDLQSYQMYRAMFGGNIVFKGYPTDTGDGNVVNFNGGIAMSSKCSDKDAAWEFMRTLFSEKYQMGLYNGFPTNQAAFDKIIARAMEKETYIDPETGEEKEVSKGGWGWGSLDVEIFAATQEDIDEIMELIDSTSKLGVYDQSIQDIVMQEALGYFSGQKSAAETASVIQSRISMYVSEQL